MANLSMQDAVSLAIREIMTEDAKTLVIGIDLMQGKGSPEMVTDLRERFSPDRVVNLPCSPSAVAGMALGLCHTGYIPICRFSHAGFVQHALRQIEDHIARCRGATRGRYTAPMVIHVHHDNATHAAGSQSASAWMRIPGLKAVIPSTPRNARAMMRAALLDPDPVVSCDPATAAADALGEIPDEPENGRIGRAEIVRAGTHLTIVTFGASVPTCLDAAAVLATRGIHAEVVDLLTLSPMDIETPSASARRTRRCMIVHDGPLTGGPGAEIAASVAEACGENLVTPIRRVAGHDLPPERGHATHAPDANQVAAAAGSLAAM